MFVVVFTKQETFGFSVGKLSLKIKSSFLSDYCAKIGQRFFSLSTLDHSGMVAFINCRRCHYGNDDHSQLDCSRFSAS